MNRRNFVQSLMAGFAAVAIDPEQLLWTPGSKTIFLPTEPKIIAPDKPEIFDSCMDLNRALREPAYFMSQVIGQKLSEGQLSSLAQQDDEYWEYIKRFPPEVSPFNSRYLS